MKAVQSAIHDLGIEVCNWFAILVFLRWQDCYWQASATSSHKISSGTDKTWVLRSKAETEHGGGAAGKAAIDDAVAAGIYRERTVFKGRDKDGRAISIQQIQQVVQTERAGHSFEIQEKHRVGGQSSGDAFNTALMDGFASRDDPEVKKKPAAIADKEPAAIADKKLRAIADKEPVPAPASSIKKKPAAAKPDASPLTEANLDKKNAEMADQNDQLNKCLIAAQQMLQKQEMANKRTLATIQREDVIPDSKKRMKTMHIEELTTLTSDVEKTIQDVKEASLHQQDIAHSDMKIDLLDRAHNVINDSKDVVKGLQGMMKGAASNEKASVRSSQRG